MIPKTVYANLVAQKHGMYRSIIMVSDQDRTRNEPHPLQREQHEHWQWNFISDHHANGFTAYIILGQYDTYNRYYR